jgi:hypothetical protein
MGSDLCDTDITIISIALRQINVVNRCQIAMGAKGQTGRDLSGYLLREHGGCAL